MIYQLSRPRDPPRPLSVSPGPDHVTGDRRQGYVRLLEMEKKDRMSTEKRALELLQDIKRKWKRDEEERLKVVQDEVKVGGLWWRW